MTSHKFLTPLAAFALFLSAAVFAGPAFSQVCPEWKTYSSQGNPKTAGHDFTFEYPPDYKLPDVFAKDKYIQTFA